MEKRLRIAIICDAIDDESLGGSFISGKRFAKWLFDVGHDIIWITSKFTEEEKRKEFSYAKIYEFPHTPRVWAYGVRFAYTSVARLSKIFQQEKIDIIYSIQPNITAWQSVRAAKKLYIPIISHSHTLPEMFAPWAPNFIQKLIKKIVANMYRKYDGLISPTEFLKEKFDDCGFTMKQVVIGNGVDTTIFQPIQQTSQDTFTITYVGRLDPAKNLTLLLDAIHLLSKEKLSKQLRCEIVGWGVMEKKLSALVESYGIWNIIKFTGKLPAASPALVKAFQKASVFVLPSLYETEGMVVLEAMACGCPILIANSEHSAAKNFVQGNGYVFDPQSPQDLADKLIELMNNPRELTLMREKSLQESSRFTFAQSIKKLEDFFLSYCKK